MNKDDKVVDIGEASLEAYRRRQARDGKIVAYPAASPLIRAAQAAGTIVDLDWLDQTLANFPEPLHPILAKVINIMAHREPGGCTEANIARAAYRALKVLECKGLLAQFADVVLPDPGDLVLGTVNLPWLLSMIEKLPAQALPVLYEAAKVEGGQQPEGATDANVAVALYQILMCAEADGTLEVLREEPTDESYP